MDLSLKNEHSFWTVEEIAELTGLSERTIWRFIASSKLGSVKLQGSRRVRHSQLVIFLGFDPLKEPALIKSIVDSVARRNEAIAHESPLPLFSFQQDEK